MYIGHWIGRVDANAVHIHPMYKCIVCTAYTFRIHLTDMYAFVYYSLCMCTFRMYRVEYSVHTVYNILVVYEYCTGWFARVIKLAVEMAVRTSMYGVLCIRSISHTN